MGTSQSKLSQLSTEEVSSYVTNLGDKYHSYGQAITSNAVDGEVLMEMEDADEFKETLECLEITNKLHQKVLIKEWKKATNEGKAAPKTSLRRMRTSFTVATCSDASELTMDDTELSSPSAYCRPIVDEAPAIPPPSMGDGPPSSLSISVQHKQVLEPLDLPKSLDLLPAEDRVLQPFHQLATQVLGDLKGAVAQVNLLDTEMEAGVDRKGVNNLATVMPSMPGVNQRMHFDDPSDHEICRKFILGSDQDFHVEDIPKEVSTAFGMKESAKYYGHVVEHGNLRVGTICTIIEETPGKVTSSQRKQEILGFLASLVKGQLEKRETLLQRMQHLKQDLRQIKQSGDDPILAPPVGPLKAVQASQVASRQTLFPYPQEAGPHPNGYPTQPQFTRRSVGLPAFEEQATEAERSHLSPNYDDEPLFSPANEFPLDRTPVGKRDMERAALLETLRLLQLDPLSAEADTIGSLVELTGNVLQADLVFVNLLTSKNCNLFFKGFPRGPWPEMEGFPGPSYHEMVHHPRTGEAFHWQSGSRANSICNYALATPRGQSFVVHDLEQDQSLSWYKHAAGMGFYSGSPIMMQGLAVGVLCCVNREPRHDFGRVQELQQEQFAQLIGLQYETWAINGEVQQLERERNLFLTSSTPVVNRPEDYAALVFTSVQGSNALMEASPNAMNQAMETHNQILRSKIAECGGYEVASEGGAFQVAFADSVDAVQFCLKTQESLQAAPWGPDLLDLPQAQHAGAFRGLRVKMAIHCWDVESTTGQYPGKMTYSGETLHIAKGLESMAHGGQILITSDVWNVASHLVDSTLGSPQVMDLGGHIVPTNSCQLQDGVTTKNVLQIVPASLAHDYHQSRRLGEGVSRHSSGRTFPRIKTKKSVSACFHDAPFADNNVVLVYMDTSEVESMVDDSGLLLTALSKRISGILKEQQPDGYQCKDFMMAFDESAAAVRFGLAVQEDLERNDVLGLSLKGRIRIGVHEGVFDTMGPNPSNGRADYVGKVVNRVAMVAEAAALGSVYLGKEAEDMDQFSLQPVSNGFMMEFARRTCFESVEEEFTLYNCKPCKSWYAQMMDKRNGRHSLSSPWR